VLQHHKGEKSLNKGGLCIVGRRALVFCTGIVELQVSQTAAVFFCLPFCFSICNSQNCVFVGTPNFHRCFNSTFSFQSTLLSITVIFTSIFLLRAKWKLFELEVPAFSIPGGGHYSQRHGMNIQDKSCK